MATTREDTYVPTHTDFTVHFHPGEYKSYLRSRSAFKAGQIMSYVTGILKQSKTYTTVAYGPASDDNIYLANDLKYTNHSCEPNAAFDFSSSDHSEWHLRALKDINPGDLVTFFYPSTEWDMIQPFLCECEKPTCLGEIKGAKYLSKEDLLARGYISPWILLAVKARDDQEL